MSLSGLLPPTPRQVSTPVREGQASWQCSWRAHFLDQIDAQRAPPTACTYGWPISPQPDKDAKEGGKRGKGWGCPSEQNYYGVLPVLIYIAPPEHGRPLRDRSMPQTGHPASHTAWGSEQLTDLPEETIPAVHRAKENAKRTRGRGGAEAFAAPRCACGARAMPASNETTAVAGPPALVPASAGVSRWFDPASRGGRGLTSAFGLHVVGRRVVMAARLVLGRIFEIRMDWAKEHLAAEIVRDRKKYGVRHAVSWW